MSAPAPPQVNPYAPMSGSGAPGDEVQDRMPPRWLALFLALFSGALAGSGLVVLGRRRLGLVCMAAGLIAWASFVLPMAPALTVAGMVACVLLWLFGLVMTALARPGRFPGWPITTGLIVLVFAEIGIAQAAKAYVAEAFQIPSGAMIPTLLVGDHILVDKTVSQPRRGDVIVFRFPPDPTVTYIKRLIGLPGERVDVVAGEVRVDGKPLARWQVDEPCQAPVGTCRVFEERAEGRTYRVRYFNDRQRDAGPFQIPPGHLFVMGDNRDDSADSRIWGTVPLELVVGRATTVWYSRAPHRHRRRVLARSGRCPPQHRPGPSRAGRDRNHR